MADNRKIASYDDSQPHANDSLFKKIAVAMMGDPGLSPMGLGVVAGSKGGQALAEQLVNDTTKMSPNGAIVRYMQLKYPKLMSAITGGVSFSDNLGPANGMFYDAAMGPYIKLNSRTLKDPVFQTANTLGHELTHGGVQAVRTPEMIGSDYVNYTPSAGPANYQAYFNQPAEVNARKGGDTAVSTLLKYLSKYPELHAVFGLDK